jgi:hypothetical protein
MQRGYKKDKKDRSSRGGDEKGTQCLEVQLGYLFLGEYIIGDVTLQVGWVLNQIQKNSDMSPVGLGPDNHCAGEAQQQLYTTHPSSRQTGYIRL